MHHRTKLFFLFGLLMLVASTGLFVGTASLSVSQVIEHLLALSSDDFVIHQYRLPRALLAISVGAGLGLSGVLVQGVIRNPLASPDLMGISAGAGLAATTCLVLFPSAPVNILPLVAMLGGILAAGLIALLAWWSQPTPAKLALIGIAVSAFLTSGIDFLLITNPLEINTAMVWLTGSLWGRNWQQVPFIWGLGHLAPVCFLASVAFRCYGAWRRKCNHAWNKPKERSGFCASGCGFTC